MEIGSHYYAVLALCRLLGLKKEIAYKIAYSSQFVDDAVIDRIIFKKTASGVKYFIHNEKKVLNHCCTCPKIHVVWTYSHSRMLRTLVPFHFIPVCKGGAHSRQIRTGPDSPILHHLLEAAVSSGNPYHLGILLHVLGDAYAHRGFSGIVSRGNRIRKLRVDMNSISGSGDRLLAHFIAKYPKLHSKTMARILPMYSHSRVGTVPDLASAKWSYEYDAGIGVALPKFRSSGPISNPERYKQAFLKMADLIEDFIKIKPEFREKAPQNLEESGFFEQLVSVISRDDIQILWSNYMIELGLFDTSDTALEYDKHAWLISAFSSYKKNMQSRYIMKNTLAREDLARSDWYAFYLAQREYKEHYDRLLVKYEIY